MKFIDLIFLGSIKEFAKENNVTEKQVLSWLEKDYVVINGTRYVIVVLTMFRDLQLCLL